MAVSRAVDQLTRSALADRCAAATACGEPTGQVGRISTHRARHRRSPGPAGLCDAADTGCGTPSKPRSQGGRRRRPGGGDASRSAGGSLSRTREAMRMETSHSPGGTGRNPRIIPERPLQAVVMAAAVPLIARSVARAGVANAPSPRAVAHNRPRALRETAASSTHAVYRVQPPGWLRS